MNATYWNIDDGQLKDGETLDSGAADKDTAIAYAAELPARCRATVRRLTTHESDYPKESPLYESFPSARWCVIVRE